MPQVTMDWAIQLLDAAPRAANNPLRKQRVWSALTRTPARRARPVWRVAVGGGSLLAVLVGATAIASAARGHWPSWAVTALGRLLPSANEFVSGTTDNDASSTAPRRRHGQQQQDLRPGTLAYAAPPMNDPDLIPPSDDALAVPNVSSGERVARSAGPANTGLRGPGVRSAAPHVARASADDARTIVAAIKALRREKDPARARALSRRYLAAHPRGALAQEALAISIEAAIAQQDPEAAALGRQYLRFYPDGPFGALARRASPRTSRATPDE